MRDDYDYVNNATDLNLTVTDKGADHINRIVETNREIAGNTREELMLFLMEDYVVVENQAPVKQWWRKAKEVYEHQYGTNFDVSYDTFLKALKDGYVTVEKVVWD